MSEHENPDYRYQGEDDELDGKVEAFECESCGEVQKGELLEGMCVDCYEENLKNA